MLAININIRIGSISLRECITPCHNKQVFLYNDVKEFKNEIILQSTAINSITITISTGFFSFRSINNVVRITFDRKFIQVSCELKVSRHR